MALPGDPNGNLIPNLVNEYHILQISWKCISESGFYAVQQTCTFCKLFFLVWDTNSSSWERGKFFDKFDSLDEWAWGVSLQV